MERNETAEQMYSVWLKEKCRIFNEDWGIPRTTNPDKKFKIVDYTISNADRLKTKSCEDLFCMSWERSSTVIICHSLFIIS